MATEPEDDSPGSSWSATAEEATFTRAPCVGTERTWPDAIRSTTWTDDTCVSDGIVWFVATASLTVAVAAVAIDASVCNADPEIATLTDPALVGADRVWDALTFTWTRPMETLDVCETACVDWLPATASTTEVLDVLVGAARTCAPDTPSVRLICEDWLAASREWAALTLVSTVAEADCVTASVFWDPDTELSMLPVVADADCATALVVWAPESEFVVAADADCVAALVFWEPVTAPATAVDDDCAAAPVFWEPDTASDKATEDDWVVELVFWEPLTAW
jgi:hypothetical protein